MLKNSVTGLHRRLRLVLPVCGAAAVVSAGLLTSLVSPDSVAAAPASAATGPALPVAATPTTTTSLVARPIIKAVVCAKRATYPCS
jgi:hypothetical protein